VAESRCAIALTQTCIGGKVDDLRAWFGGAEPRGMEGFSRGFEVKARQSWGVVSFSSLSLPLFDAVLTKERVYRASFKLKS